LAEDDVEAIKKCIIEAFARGIPATASLRKSGLTISNGLAAVDASHQLGEQ